MNINVFCGTVYFRMKLVGLDMFVVNLLYDMLCTVNHSTDSEKESEEYIMWSGFDYSGNI